MARDLDFVDAVEELTKMKAELEAMLARPTARATLPAERIQLRIRALSIALGSIRAVG